MILPRPSSGSWKCKRFVGRSAIATSTFSCALLFELYILKPISLEARPLNSFPGWRRNVADSTPVEGQITRQVTAAYV